jgi:hypothetical protein
MPSTDRKLELKAKTSLAQTGSQPFVSAKGLTTDVVQQQFTSTATSVLTTKSAYLSLSAQRRSDTVL